MHKHETRTRGGGGGGERGEMECSTQQRRPDRAAGVRGPGGDGWDEGVEEKTTKSSQWSHNEVWELQAPAIGQMVTALTHTHRPLLGLFCWDVLARRKSSVQLFTFRPVSSRLGAIRPRIRLRGGDQGAGTSLGLRKHSSRAVPTIHSPWIVRLMSNVGRSIQAFVACTWTLHASCM
jgi:hypothetical protein